MKAVFKHEVSSYFTGLTGYVFGAFLLLFTGIYCMVYNISGGLTNYEYVPASLPFIFIIIIPILTMRVISLLPPLKHDAGSHRKIYGTHGGIPGARCNHVYLSADTHGIWSCVSPCGFRYNASLLPDGRRSHSNRHVCIVTY